MRLIVVLLAALLLLTISCSERGDSGSDPVSVVRIRSGEMMDGQCRFADDLSGYPATFSTDQENCWQAVTIGPLTPGEVERMKQDVPLFWERSSPYQQALVGERIGGECEFSNPAVQAYLEFSEPSSTDLENCVMIVDVGPATEKQIEEVQRHGSVSSETAAPAPSVPSPGQ